MSVSSVSSPTRPDRRSLIRNSGLLLGGSAIAGPLQSLVARQAMAQQGPYSSRTPSVLGRIRPVNDKITGLPLLKLPRGFSYRSFGWTGDLMDDGSPTPARPDGMAVVGWDPTNGTLTLVRNHEVSNGPRIQAPQYDDRPWTGAGQGLVPGGGTTTLVYRRRKWRSAVPSLGGTMVNCAGGPTPWGSWLSCEETVRLASQVGGRDHGFVFEVPAAVPANGVPLTAMGLMRHEAVAVDPSTNFAYLTEDNGDTSGFYRFLPNNTSGNIGSYESGGRLQMLRVSNDANADLRLPEQGALFNVDWVDIPDPLALPDDTSDPLDTDGRSGPYRQGQSNGGARFARGEGCWQRDGVVYFADTSGGPNRDGVIWCYRPNPNDAAGGGTLEAIFVSPEPRVGNSPDNITVSPQGALLYCEDGDDAAMRIMGVTPEGRSYSVCKNNIILDSNDIAAMGRTGQFSPGDYTDAEFCGACFSVSGNTLFVNIQKPGVTFAIRGPWRRLAPDAATAGIPSVLSLDAD